MYIERNNILNNYAKQTLDKGEMYYIYSANSKKEDLYNLCICKEEKSHIVLEVTKHELPEEAKIGSVLRKEGEIYILDNEGTKKIEEEIYKLKSSLLEEQSKELDSRRIENNIYEVSEKDIDRVWLFNITNNDKEALEEIGFPKELLQNAKEGDLFIYKNKEYKKY